VNQSEDQRREEVIGAIPIVLSPESQKAADDLTGIDQANQFILGYLHPSHAFDLCHGSRQPVDTDLGWVEFQVFGSEEAETAVALIELAIFEWFVNQLHLFFVEDPGYESVDFFVIKLLIFGRLEGEKTGEQLLELTDEVFNCFDRLTFVLQIGFEGGHESFEET